jgi:hypothetical protein
VIVSIPFGNGFLPSVLRAEFIRSLSMPPTPRRGYFKVSSQEEDEVVEHLLADSPRPELQRYVVHDEDELKKGALPSTPATSTFLHAREGSYQDAGYVDDTSFDEGR